MLNALQSYQFGTAPLRVVMVQADPWFAATDVAHALGYRDAEKLTRILDDDEKDTHIVGTLGGNQELTIISESGLYAAIFKSRRPEAQAFRKWVTSEVLPSIRRTGSFSMSDADPVKRMGAALKLVAEARRLQGRGAAIAVWDQMGLPPLPPVPDPEPDELLEPLAAWAEGQQEVEVVQALSALEIEDQSQIMRRRIAGLLRRLGWASRTARRGDRVSLIFKREG